MMWVGKRSETALERQTCFPASTRCEHKSHGNVVAFYFILFCLCVLKKKELAVLLGSLLNIKIHAQRESNIAQIALPCTSPEEQKVHLLRIHRFHFGIVAGVGKKRGTSENFSPHLHNVSS